ncbi:MAG: YcgJ family protein [Cyanobium sp.]
MIRQPQARVFVRGLTTAVLPLCLGMGAVAPARAQYGTLAFPQSGVVCDPAGQICYDQQGISLGLTRTYYGQRAEKDLLMQFSNQPMPREFRLSEGSVCSVPARSCWSDGWNRRFINQPLTKQLFGSSNQVISKENGYCRLDNWGLRIYNGRCRLIRAIGNPEFMGATYTVRLPNNNELVFGNRRGYLVVRSGGRNYPAQFQNLSNNTALFRWGTQQLLVNTLSYGPSGAYGTPPLPSPVYNTPYRSTYSGEGVNWNGAIEGFLNGLFQ